MSDGWNIFECSYTATKGNSIMSVIDWLWTGAKDISINNIGHYWKCHGYIISNQSYKQVDKQPQENAIIKFIQ